MDGWARGEREDGGVGARRGKRREKEPVRWSRGKGEEERNGSVGEGWGGRGAGDEFPAVKRAGNMQQKGKAEGTHLKGKRGAKEPGSGWGDVGKKGRRTEV